jgi:ribose transport system substrate-binding protein
VLVQEPSNTVIIAGGQVDHRTLSTRGSMTQNAIGEFRADKAFFSCTGVSVHSGLTEVSTEGAASKRRMKDAADSVFVLVESDRIGKTDPFPVAELAEPRRIVTDGGVEMAQVQALVKRNAQVAVCSTGGHQTHRLAQSRTFRIGFANLSDQVWFAQDVRRGLEQAAQLAGNIELRIADNRASVESAVQNVQSFLRDDIDLLIEYDGTGKAGRPIMRMARPADVPVIAIDIPITGATYFGSDHDAIGMVAGHALGEWIERHWNGQLENVLLLGSQAGDGQGSGHTVHVEGPTWDSVPLRLAPTTRLDAALDALCPLVKPIPHTSPLSCPESWATSQHAVDVIEKLLDAVLPTIPIDHRVAAICIVNEYALGLARAVRKARRSDRFVAVSFGSRDQATLSELSNPDTCLLGLVDLGAERYGEQLLQTSLRLLRGQAVLPAIFVEHRFLSRDEVQ